MRNFFVGFAVITAASPVAASNWVKITANTSSTVFIDTSSMSTDEGYKAIWTKWIYSSGKLSEAKYLVLYDCDKRRTALRSGVLYNRDHTTESATAEDYELKWEPVVPDSLGEDVFETICQ